MVLLGGDGTFKRWGLVGDLEVIGSESFKRIVGLQPPTCSLYLLIYLASWP
jgi:hypothetical protein